MEWWYAENGRQFGPVKEETFRQLVAVGTVKPATFVWHAGLEGWKPYSEVAGPAAPPPQAPPPPAAAPMEDLEATQLMSTPVNLAPKVEPKPQAAWNPPAASTPAPGYGAAQPAYNPAPSAAAAYTPAAASYNPVAAPAAGAQNPAWGAAPAAQNPAWGAPATPAAQNPAWGAPATPAAQPAAPAKAFCSECGTPHAPSELMQFGAAMVCANCKPAFTQRLRESGAPRAVTTAYGGFWIRFLARIIDGLILGALGFVLSLPMTAMARTGEVGLVLAFQGLLMIVQIAAGVAYEAYFLVNQGGTLGKLALGLQVVTPDGYRLTYGRAVGRYFAHWINAFTLGIGYIIAAFDAEKRGLHDHICGTRVIRKLS